eukprot:906510_1
MAKGVVHHRRHESVDLDDWRECDLKQSKGEALSAEWPDARDLRSNEKAASEVDWSKSGDVGEPGEPEGLFALPSDPSISSLEAISSASPLPPPSVTFLYGSQTGNAQEIAKTFYDEALHIKMNAKVKSLKEIKQPAEQLAEDSMVVFVVSTTGNGDPPDNATRFWRKFRKLKESQCLKDTYFTVLALGDTNYDKFCDFGCHVDRKMAELGAHRFYKLGCADDAIGLELVVEPWRAGLLPAIMKQHRLLCAKSAGDPELVIPKYPVPTSISSKLFSAGTWTGLSPRQTTADVREPRGLTRFRSCTVKLVLHPPQTVKVDGGDTPDVASSDRFALRDSNLLQDDHPSDVPFLAHITKAEYLTSKESDKHVLLLEIDLSQCEEDVVYDVGDVVGFYCSNSPDMVNDLLQRLVCDGDQLFHLESVSAEAANLPSPARAHSFRDALLHCYDISAPPRKAFLRMLAEYCADSKERTELYLLASPSGRKNYSKLCVSRPSLVSILRRFPSCQPPLDHLFDLLPPLKPRVYSVA